MIAPDDALIAAPEHHRLVHEDEEVRVLETRIEPGDTVPAHSHPWPSINIVLGFAPVVRRDADGVVTLDSRERGIVFDPGQAFRSGPLPTHTLENVGTNPIHVYSVELKR